MSGRVLMKNEKLEAWEEEKRKLLEKMIEKVSSLNASGGNPSQQVQEQK